MTQAVPKSVMTECLRSNNLLLFASRQPVAQGESSSPAAFPPPICLMERWLYARAGPLPIFKFQFLHFVVAVFSLPEEGRDPAVSCYLKRKLGHSARSEESRESRFIIRAPAPHVLPFLLVIDSNDFIFTSAVFPKCSPSRMRDSHHPEAPFTLRSRIV